MSIPMSEEELNEVVAGLNRNWRRYDPDAPAPYKLYIVRPGDCISVIAEMFGCTCEDIYNLNKITKDTIIYAGNWLIVKNVNAI